MAETPKNQASPWLRFSDWDAMYKFPRTQTALRALWKKHIPTLRSYRKGGTSTAWHYLHKDDVMKFNEIVKQAPFKTIDRTPLNFVGYQQFKRDFRKLKPNCTIDDKKLSTLYRAEISNFKFCVGKSNSRVVFFVDQEDLLDLVEAVEAAFFVHASKSERQVQEDNNIDLKYVKISNLAIQWGVTRRKIELAISRFAIFRDTCINYYGMIMVPKYLEDALKKELVR